MRKIIKFFIKLIIVVSVVSIIIGVLLIIVINPLLVQLKQLNSQF